MRPVSSQRIPESSTAITTSGRPVVTVHAVSGAAGQAVAVEPVVGAVRAQAHRESQVAPRLRPPPGLLQSPPQAEMREVVHRRALDHSGELLPGLGVAAGAEVGAAERLADRGLVGLEATGALERDRGG